MPEIKQGLNLGDLLKYEAPNLYSRDRITVAAGQTLAPGHRARRGDRQRRADRPGPRRGGR
jgi:Bacteriophage lambda head decoration protein D